MLKPVIAMPVMAVTAQPPLGGCVLKPRTNKIGLMFTHPAAFRRLCVETIEFEDLTEIFSQPPLGGCVLKQPRICLFVCKCFQPPLGGCVLKHCRPFVFGRLFFQPPLGGCVLKQHHADGGFAVACPSRLQAAVC